MTRSERSTVYSVSITDKAVYDAEQACAWILADSPPRALQWFEGLIEAIDGLRTFPHRCPVAPESKRLPCEVRQLVYGHRRSGYRVLFWIREEQQRIIVLRIRHCARLELSVSELFNGL